MSVRVPFCFYRLRTISIPATWYHMVYELMKKQSVMESATEI